MPAKVIGTCLGLGYPGSYSRMSDCVIANRIAKENIAFGSPVVLNEDNTYSPFGAENTSDNFVGIAVREVKQQTDIYNVNGIYNSGEPTDVLYRGSIVVEIKNGDPIAGKKVFVRIARNEEFPDSNIGDFEAKADGTNTIELSNVKFTTGQKDANGVAEVTVLTRQA